MGRGEERNEGGDEGANFVCPGCGAASLVWIEPHAAEGDEAQEECPRCFRAVRVRYERAPDGGLRCAPSRARDAAAGEFDPASSYRCPSCGEEVQVWIDSCNGAVQELVEDCPVCCRPNVVRATIAADGTLRVDAQAE